MVLTPCWSRTMTDIAASAVIIASVNMLLCCPDKHEQLYQAHHFHEKYPRLVVYVRGILAIVCAVHIDAYDYERHV